ncbi:hypothetical protein [Natrinema altunense]|uniref:Uncharacterized protein n=1 Tax=Natrinema altunense (strain JCM 12890 / CGMCC 1.3731 / AJ2) TaxID=1227494 RepID=L9ZAY2_NATA2|nr:hypothetical protein [Natrinema altunense]ELY83635.1 hypothetical protein C485_17822 [Natrinema altunense JCM 12890]
MQFELYFLRYYDEPDFEFQDEAEDLFFLAAEDEVEYLTESGFETLYEKIAVGNASDPEYVFEVQDKTQFHIDELVSEPERPMWDGDVIRMDDGDYMIQGDQVKEIDILEEDYASDELWRV